jgi:hypothetical protein
LVWLAKGNAVKIGEIRRGVIDNMPFSIENNGSVDAAAKPVLSQAATPLQR